MEQAIIKLIDANEAKHENIVDNLKAEVIQAEQEGAREAHKITGAWLKRYGQTVSRMVNLADMIQEASFLSEEIKEEAKSIMDDFCVEKAECDDDCKGCGQDETPEKDKEE